jgi:hypothetical protein
MAKNNETTSIPVTYFNKQRHPKLELFFMILIGIGVGGFALFYMMFYWWFAYICIGIAAIGITGYFILNAHTSKDADYDEYLKRLLDIKNIHKDGEVIENYDLGAEHIKVGHDKKVRSSVYSIAIFNFKKDTFTLDWTLIDIMASNEYEVATTEKHLTLPRGTKCEVAEIEIPAKPRPIKGAYIVFSDENGEELRIPATAFSCDTDEIAKRISEKR